MGMDTSVRVARGMTQGRKGRGPRGAIGDTDSRSTSGPDPAAEDIRIVTHGTGRVPMWGSMANPQPHTSQMQTVRTILTPPGAA